MNREAPNVNVQDIERYRAQARRMQSREIARLSRRLFAAPVRLLRRARAGREGVVTRTRHV